MYYYCLATSFPSFLTRFRCKEWKLLLPRAAILTVDVVLLGQLLTNIHIYNAYYHVASTAKYFYTLISTIHIQVLV